jgi:hypothetical protein
MTSSWGWTDRFKFGSMKSEDDLARDLTNTVRTRDSTSTYDSVIRSVVTGIVMKFVISWYKQVISKYTEQEYHQMIRNPNCVYTDWQTGEKYIAEYDFLLDWQEHHRQTFNKFINALRRVRSKIDFSEDELVLRTRIMLESDAGWTVFPDEEAKFRAAIVNVKRIIYA